MPLRGGRARGIELAIEQSRYQRGGDKGDVDTLEYRMRFLENGMYSLENGTRSLENGMCPPKMGCAPRGGGTLPRGRCLYCSEAQLLLCKSADRQPARELGLQRAGGCLMCNKDVREFAHATIGIVGCDETRRGFDTTLVIACSYLLAGASACSPAPPGACACRCRVKLWDAAESLRIPRERCVQSGLGTERGLSASLSVSKRPRARASERRMRA